MLFLPIAAIAALVLAQTRTQTRCPVTGSLLTRQQLADPALRIGGKTVCCKDCVTKYAARMRAGAQHRVERFASKEYLM
jgi:hypothetical protein